MSLRLLRGARRRAAGTAAAPSPWGASFHAAPCSCLAAQAPATPLAPLQVDQAILSDMQRPLRMGAPFPTPLDPAGSTAAAASFPHARPAGGGGRCPQGGGAGSRGMRTAVRAATIVACTRQRARRAPPRCTTPPSRAAATAPFSGRQSRAAAARLLVPGLPRAPCGPLAGGLCAGPAGQPAAARRPAAAAARCYCERPACARTRCAAAVSHCGRAALKWRLSKRTAARVAQALCPRDWQ